MSEFSEQPPIPSLTPQQKEELMEQFRNLSPDAQRLLISSSHFSTQSGGKRDAFLEVSGLEPEQYGQAEQELMNKGLLNQGYPPDIQPPSQNVNSEQRRYLTPETRQFIFEDILQLPPASEKGSQQD